MSEPAGVDRPPSYLFRVEITVDRSVVLAAIAGEVDLSSAEALGASILGPLRLARPSHFILDLRGVTFLDSTGVRLLLSLDDQARETGCRMIVVRGPDQVQRVISLVGLDEHFEFVDGPSAGSEDSSAAA